MKTIHVKRNFTFIDDRSPKYFVANEKVMGKIFPIMDNLFSIKDDNVEVYVKDILGMKSNRLPLHGEGDFQLEYRLNRVWVISTSLLLLITFILIGITGIPAVRSCLANNLLLVYILPVVWLIYMSITFIFLRNKLYFLVEI